MKYSFYPTKDATIYSISGSMNTGLDEILEISKTRNSDINYFGRALLKWDWAAASQSLAALPSFEASASAAEYKLKLFTTKAQNIRYSYKIVSSNLTQDWDMGIGKANSTPITDEGVSGGFRTESGSDAWTLVGGTTGSAATDNVQSFEYETTDINLLISSSIQEWENTPANNHGLSLHFTSSQEADTKSYGTIKFFSRDTNTIYTPRIEVSWDDSIFSTGSLEAQSADEIVVYIKNNKFEYKEDSKVRFQVRARDVYPSASYASTHEALVNYYLPSTSYYSIKDAETEETIIDFNTSFTKLSCTSSGNFFDLYMNGLTAERMYKVLFRVDDRTFTGQREYFDNNHLFKIVR